MSRQESESNLKPALPPAEFDRLKTSEERYAESLLVEIRSDLMDAVAVPAIRKEVLDLIARYLNSTNENSSFVWLLTEDRRRLDMQTVSSEYFRDILRKSISL